MEPSKSLFVLFYVSSLLAGCATSQGGSRRSVGFLDESPVFRLSIDKESLARGEVAIEIRVPRKTRKFIAPPHYGGGPLFFRFLSDVRAEDAKGTPLPLRIEGNLIWVTPPDIGTTYTLKYTYKVPQKVAGEVDQSIPTLDMTHARFDNNVTFPMPDGLSESNARLSITGPESWPIVTSWGPGGSFTVSKVSQLIAGTIVMGAYEYSTQKVGRFLCRYRGFLEANPRYPSSDYAAIQRGFANGDDANLTDLAYTKGPFVAALLDLAIRDDTRGAQSLVSWFRSLLKRFGGRTGYTEKDLRSMLVEITSRADGLAARVFENAFIGGGALDLDALFRRLAMRCNKRGDCTLLETDETSKVERTKLFSGRM